MKTAFDEKILQVAGLVIWRLRTRLGLSHWQIVSCVDALFAGCLILMLLLSQHHLLLFLGAIAILGASPSSRRWEFLPQEEAATLLNRPMKNLRQERSPHCWLRYVTCVVFASLVARSLRFGDWIPLCVFVVGMARALSEATDIYPSNGRTVRDRSKISLPVKAAEGMSRACLPNGCGKWCCFANAGVALFLRAACAHVAMPVIG